MKILALETSCDDTACAVIEDGRNVLSHVMSSQASFHAQYGGIIPEFAARQHTETLHYVLEQALHEAHVSLSEIDAFAATLGPGLVGALLAGATTAKTLSVMTGKPFIGVNHLHGHIASNYLASDLEPPFITLLVSGGHTQLLKVSAYTDIEIKGQTCDDALGEAYDKVARLMGLPYPGGPMLDKMAQLGNPKAYILPVAQTKGLYDFSYSGLKTAMLRLLQPFPQPINTLDQQIQYDLAASFQAAAVKPLFKKLLKLAEAEDIKTLTVAGGVSANSALRQGMLDTFPEEAGWRVYFPALEFCTDNAAMIGSCAYFNPLTNDMQREVFSRAKR
jgi:N6-L-threonylcarbamoyladenine synthase